MVRRQPLHTWLFAASSLAFTACGGAHPDDVAVAHVAITTTSAIPSDGQCTHIRATRTGDFKVSEYQGLLAGATFQAMPGEQRVTATAYPQPCTSEPATAPWSIAPLTVTFATGANTLPLEFKRNTPVTIAPVFDTDPQPLLVEPGSYVRTGRNGEDIAGPNYALDGWEVRQLVPGGERVLFSTRGKGLPYPPVGLAHTPDGTFVAQLSTVSSPMYAFDEAGNSRGTWSVSYAAGQNVWDNTDGLEAIDATHFVRTGYGGPGVGCDANGDNCIIAGLDILVKNSNADGSVTLQVERQIMLPQAYGSDYPVGVAPLPGGRFAVSTLPASGTQIMILDGTGALVAGPISLDGDVEGLADAGGGRLLTVDYLGKLVGYDETTLAARAGDVGDLGEGVRVSNPVSLAWHASSNELLVLSQQRDVLLASPAFDRATSLGLNLTDIVVPQSIDYRADTDEILVGDMYAWRAPATSTSLPTIHVFSMTTKAEHHLQLNPALGFTPRMTSIAYLPSVQKIAAHFRRPGSAADPKVDAAVYVMNLDGTVAYSFDLAPLGFTRISSLRYDVLTDELIAMAVDSGGTWRLVAVDRFGTPHRSYRIDALPDLVEAAVMTSGPYAGDFGAVSPSPSSYARIALP